MIVVDTADLWWDRWLMLWGMIALYYMHDVRPLWSARAARRMSGRR